MAWLNRLIAGLAALSGGKHLIAAFPRGNLPQLEDDITVDSNIPHPFADYPPVIKARQQNGPDLRILPLGASIMSGVGSLEHSGLVQTMQIIPKVPADFENKTSKVG